MIITEIIGNVDNISSAGRHIERVYLSSDELVKRIQRVTTDHGKEMGIRLMEQKDLVDGDILYMDERNMIVVSVTSDDLLVLRPSSIKQMGEIAHQLGNRHLPAQFEDEVMLVQYDYLVEELLVQLEIPYTREERKVKKAFRHIGHSHE
ncbi:urease accessory protein UreE [Neobacillus sp. CF12]|uniref:urease accessory protein UreE n=1 Tax=Neobacillus sp. CF12 TaxID=3055864 RepID=UPI0025A0237D|nr:urease accessory protein UreE [Neobacillus sp. CF12]MDM5328824.1 urease accessory protein UreE [Neobacillus sp. CF12]